VDVIPPGDKSRGMACGVDLPQGEDFVCEYAIMARRMKPRTGTVAVFSNRPEARID
jgi:hypothetical protein